MLSSQHGAKWRSKLVFVPLQLALVLSFATAARASTIYSYTGSTFTIFIGTVPAGVTHISGSFTLATPLAANLPLTNLYTSGMAPLSISFTDGVNVFTSPDINNDFQVGTDAGGNISTWGISLGHVLGGQSMLIEKLTAFFTGDDSVDESAPSVTLWEAGTVHAGTWGAPTSNDGGGTAVPEPASLVLVVSGLIGSAGAMRRKRLRDSRS